MAFGINLDSVSGNITPIVKYDARAGRMQRVDREDGISTPHDITNNFRAVFDLENVEYGWLAFSASGPDFQARALGRSPPGKAFREPPPGGPFAAEAGLGLRR
jgi:hypothetical protein